MNLERGGVVVYAVGGNALQDPTGGEDDSKTLESVVDDVATLIGNGHPVVVTHGNGPQVGRLLELEERRLLIHREASNGSGQAGLAEMRTGLASWVAATQSMIGSTIATAIEAELSHRSLERSCAVLTTRVEVDTRDPAFSTPTKPIGMVLEDGFQPPSSWTIKETAKGMRRVVPSPRPVRIVEEDSIRAMLMAAGVVICSGGGGIPVARSSSGHLIGVDAVIDKDRTSGLLAGSLNAAAFIITTAVDCILAGFGSDEEEPIDELPLLDAIRMVEDGTFPAGSMGPKVEAMVRAKRLHPRMAVVLCSPGSASEALAGRAGTRIVTGWGDLLNH